MLQSFIDRCGCCGCNGIYASLQQHSRWLRWVLLVLPPRCLRSNQNKPRPYVISRPLQEPPLNQPEILLMTEWHRCLHIGHQVWISVNDLTVEPPALQMRRKEDMWLKYHYFGFTKVHCQGPGLEEAVQKIYSRCCCRPSLVGDSSTRSSANSSHLILILY